jgi:hypothetical protein
MTPGEIRAFIGATPFAPFRLFMTDGMSYDVRSPVHAIAMAHAIALGIDLDQDDNPQKVVYVDPRLITRVEVDIKQAPDSNGRT